MPHILPFLPFNSVLNSRLRQVHIIGRNEIFGALAGENLETIYSFSASNPQEGTLEGIWNGFLVSQTTVSVTIYYLHLYELSNSQILNDSHF